jgi:hypothetical protein
LEIETMKRMLMSGLGAAFLYGVIGCGGGGGIEEGVPASTKPDVPLDTVPGNMGAAKVNPHNLPKGSENGEAPAKK